MAIPTIATPIVDSLFGGCGVNEVKNSDSLFNVEGEDDGEDDGGSVRSDDNDPMSNICIGGLIVV